MLYEEEKDYMMRMIREISRVLFSIIFGKKYVQVELEAQEKYLVSGRPLNDLKDMVDKGLINDAENMLLEDIDYSNKKDVAAAVSFYEYLGEKPEEFLRMHDFSRQEVLDGLKDLAARSGFADIVGMVMDRDE